MRRWIQSLSVLVLAIAASMPAQDFEQVVINARDQGTPLPHFWEEMFGSGRAILTLRDSYREDLRTVKKATGFTYVRPHGIFMDEIGLFDLDAQGKPVYNFSYIDQIYDGLLENGVKPFVELSFMPKKLAADPNQLHAFWYKQNISPPKDYTLWDDMIRAFARHLVARYGIDEVATWYFEVWNEPNLDFWGGKPSMPTYYELYDHTARALKGVNDRIRVGGPSTAQAAYAGEFLAHCKQANVPVDFVSSHVYANDTAKDVFKTEERIPRDSMVCRAVSKVHNEIAASAYPDIPFILSEYNASYANEPNVTDSIFMGPWLADTIRQCDGLVDVMSYWTFSDVFEEQGVVKTPFYGGFGLLAERGIPKPAFNAFVLLHKLGDRRLELDSDDVLATKTKSGGLAIAVWNYAPPAGTGASYTQETYDGVPEKTFEVVVKGRGATSATVWRVDVNHGNVVKAYDDMGRPATPTQAQIVALKKAGALAPPERLALRGGKLTVHVPAQGLALVEIR
ncbi:glycosyl hydrolase family 39 [Terriglobus albidus]|uniref:Glycosyl hydrolase family 39 n=1 Tax=Terriglobus albidus TaxID=1592106 RepID=A0A5B9EGG8_9BACT|nr:glycosyl hydrolase family 39 [Terriglobus albidus]QEE29900.1 glycosyl hydrolase family 39 [Terriglobus albidus]